MRFLLHYCFHYLCLFNGGRSLVMGLFIHSFIDVLLKVCYPDKFTLDFQVNNKGSLKLDATVSDQDITYPTDKGLLNTGREKTKYNIDTLEYNDA